MVKPLLCGIMINSDDTAKIRMQGIHVELTPGLQSAIIQKFTTLLQHDRRIIRLNVRLHKDQRFGHEYHYTATAQVELSGPDLVAHADDKDAYTALDKLSQKLDQLLERRHDRRKDKRNHPHGIELASDLPKVNAPSEA
jgi:putative sigma-54 modulation protein